MLASQNVETGKVNYAPDPRFQEFSIDEPVQFPETSVNNTGILARNCIAEYFRVVTVNYPFEVGYVCPRATINLDHDNDT